MTQETIDCTPTWEGILPLLIHGIESGSPTARAAVMEELTRMAKLADRYVAQTKPAEEAP